MYTKEYPFILIRSRSFSLSFTNTIFPHQF
jgi:hypothetical protein